MSSSQTTINTVRELEQHNSKIVLVVNLTQKESFEKASKVLKQFFSYPIFEVKESTAFIKMVDQKKSIKQLMDDNFLFRYHYNLTTT